ncbi:hypothetical protein GGR52DRAFT_200011 [Hypoxylon sp. FL1284]|nr:hypothetical protein GGR52DRAFT_200011 [Hypoxylon sp. FL1284]
MLTCLQLEPHEGPEAGSNSYDATPPRSSQNDAIFAEPARLSVPDSAASRGADPRGRKRRHSTNDTLSPGSSSKRSRGREIIEIPSSSDDDDDDKAGNFPDELILGDESADDTYGSEGATNNEFGGRYANRHINDGDWSRLCRLFRCPESTTKLQPPGFGVEILAYQLHAVWWILTQQPLHNIQGGCLGDAMGLGKTVEVIATFAIFAMTKANHEEVRKFWKDGTTTEGRLHLAKQQTGDESRCPSQRTSPYPTSCTCVKSGDAYKIATTMPTLPTVCVVPPTAMRGWVAEYGKVIDATHPVASRLKLSVAHEDYKKDERLYHGEDQVKGTHGVAVQQEDTNMRLLIKGRVGLASRLILVSRHGATKLHARYDQMRTNIADGNGSLIKTNLMGAAFVFFDESHQYNGSSDSPTDPFRLLGKLRDSGYKEPSAFTVSASIPMAGPIQLANIVDHILKSKCLQSLEVKIGGISDVGVFKDRQADYNYLLDKLDRAKDSKAKKEIKIRRGRLSTLEKELAPLVLMARRPADEFRGEQIGDGSREIIVESINCPMKDGAAQVAFGRLVAEVRSYVRLTLQKQKQEWEQGGQVGPEPSERSVERNLFGDSNVGARLREGSRCAWTRLIRAGVYPALARLMEDGLIQDEDLHHGTINPLGAQACKAYLAQGRAAMVEVWKTSSLSQCRRELAQESTKFAKLRKLVDDMISYRSKVPTADDAGPRDGTNIRHMIVLADSPCSAFITYMQLAYTYKEVKVMLINASTKHEAGPSDSGYGRSQIIEDLNSPCNETSPNKILVSTYAICGAALNLQRANYCVMMEPARTTDAEKQAAARVNRRGQDMMPVTVMLYDDRNLAESVRLSRRANHKEMLSWKDNEIPWDTFVC